MVLKGIFIYFSLEKAKLKEKIMLTHIISIPVSRGLLGFFIEKHIKTFGLVRKKSLL